MDQSGVGKAQPRLVSGGDNPPDRLAGMKLTASESGDTPVSAQTFIWSELQDHGTDI